LGLGFALATPLVLWFSLPLWWPWVLAPVAHRQGAQYARYERVGYSRFALTGLTFTNETVRFKAERIEAPVPTVWLWRTLEPRRFQARQSSQPFLTITGWQFRSLPTSNATASLYTQAQSTADSLRALQRWLPRAVLSNGTLWLHETTLSVPALTWTQGVLSATLGAPGQGWTDLRADFSKPPRYEVEIRADSLHFKSALALSLNSGGLDLQSTNFWWSNRFDLRSHFDTQGTLPATASLQAPHFRIPSAWVRIPYYPDIAGDLSAVWQRGEFSLNLSASARPLPTQTNVPPLELSLRARGDTNVVTI